uniref:Genome polyprotein n=1 Tax=Potyvirus alstromeriae TaxID=260374 RepID=A0A4Y5RYD4_9POTV|nr:polyprotein [Alstroemeria mosaic virus]
MALAQATIFFGAFECKLPSFKVAPALVAPVVTPRVTVDPFAALEKQLAKRLERQAHATIRVKKNGTFVYRYPSDKAITAINRRKARRTAEEAQFKAAPQFVVSSISIAGGDAPSASCEAPVRGVIHTTPSQRKRTTHVRCELTEAAFASLLRTLKNIMAQKQGHIEVIEKRTTRVRYSTWRNKTCAIVQTRHAMGRKDKVDFACSAWSKRVLCSLARVQLWSASVQSNTLRVGDSGMVLNANTMRGNFVKPSDELFIVRGSLGKTLIEAREPMDIEAVFQMTHFSHAIKFWRGLDDSWAGYRYPTDHVCTTDIPVTECGRVASLLTHCIIPCYKMTCRTCALKYADLPFDDLIGMLHSHSSDGLWRLASANVHFPHVQRFLNVLHHLVEPLTDMDTAFNEVQRSIGDRGTGPFKHLNNLNRFFLRGKNNSASDWKEAQANFLELARFQKNRTDNIKKGDMASFRNKLSAKANWNFYLSCDNQLDKNANFLWGQREYHAKRFFSNFFEEIEPANGYSKYELRKNPNGSRQLAVGNLIVPLDLAEFRTKMRGDFVQQPPIGRQCVSMKDGNFVYPCCCTTLDDGNAVESSFYPPTKKHMVIGNSGDQKYVDLPKGDTEKLYIAREGYCYINLYLAMLINVREEDAKDFTKKVRDLCVPKLGKWPTLMDVATTCAQLRIFFPDVHDAELPRILVDHNTQTCHVVDSFGSVTTGYHVLKASTVSQLILFANDALESDIKHYAVGGIPRDADDLLTGGSSSFRRNGAEMSECRALALLVKNIFKPKRMRELLLDEPYIMLLSLVSPSILLAMYNNGAFEAAVKMWITEKQSIAMIATMLSALAEKVSVAESLVAQKYVIETSAANLYDATFDGFNMYLTYRTALNLLDRLKCRAESDHMLQNNGFQNCENQVLTLMEKSYQNHLDDSWRALTWREKLHAIWHSHQLRRYSIKPLSLAIKPDSTGLWDISPRALLVRNFDRLRQRKRLCAEAAKEYIQKKLVNCSLFFIRRTFLRMPDIGVLVNTACILSSLLTAAAMLQAIVREFQASKIKLNKLTQEENEKICLEIYANLERKLGREFTWEEFLEYVKTVNPQLVPFVADQKDKHIVRHQKSTPDVKVLEHVVAFITLVAMVFDAERSDCVFKILNKLKGIVSSLDSEVRHQSVDEIIEIFDERNTMVDFELDDEIVRQQSANDVVFEHWWERQIHQGFTIPHYRTEGKFLEFTRNTAAQVASDISQSECTDFLIRGAVGSGKSTGLPSCLSKMGSVLLIEPTRPLTENVFKQLSSAPFFLKPTLRMRGESVFGSSPISVMTSGFALHFFANNRQQLLDYTYIIFDECHVLDAAAMAFRSLVHAHHSSCKVLKVSATPPGREVEFTTQHPVKLITEENLSFKHFVDAQGTGCNVDVIQHGNNILVYVASYSEVDALAKLLNDKSMLVTKIDGRTMKHGNLDIVTRGSKGKPHFIVATNIIENGVTLDIDVVVDFGMKVSPFLDIDNRSISYNKVHVSYGERIQRLGRVGRFKSGVALRIGHTEKGLIEIPSMLATEAALYCFAYNLPVMSGNVSTNFVKQCTVRQVKTMHQFELNPFFTFNFVAHDGTMHPVIHDSLKKFKLRDSIIPLCDQSVPYKASSSWLSAGEYERLGVHLDLPHNVKVSFHVKDIPASLHLILWEAVEKYKNASIFPTIHAASVSKIAYTLSTDLFAIPRTLIFIDRLIEEERTKQYQFKSYIDSSCSNLFSIINLTNTLRAKYAKDYTGENIRKLEAVRSQLKEFSNLGGSSDEQNLIRKFESLQYVHHQDKEQLASALKLKGVWHKALILKDALIAGCVAAGGVFMIYKWFTSCISQVSHQGKSKSKRIQALKFRRTRDKRSGFEIDNNDDTIEEFFGSAYTSKGKGKGTTVGMGKSSRKFINMYGFEPSEYSYIQFVDPLTGAQIEENVYADILDIQEQFGDIRARMIENDDLDAQATYANTTIHAYLRKDWSNKALKIDLTPHNPLKICDKHNSIAKFPERAGELRQSGLGEEVDVSDIPSAVVHESRSLLRGLRDYNPIAQTICKLKASSEHGSSEMYGIGFGTYIVTNHHLFKSFNGTLEIKSQHGFFRVPNMTSLQVKPLTGRDIIIIKMPKDFPVFPQRLHFRSPHGTERVCIIGTNFQEKNSISTISETSTTHLVPRSTFWKHWISTDDGHCGLPVVSTIDGYIVGIHSLANNSNSENYYAAFDSDFEKEYLRNVEHVEWVRNWKYNPDNVLWGPLKLKQSSPTGLFKTTKLVEDLQEFESVREQGVNSNWLYDALKDNLQAVAFMSNQLVTKHVVKGPCIYFQQFLASDPEASAYFNPLLHAYGLSRLNREAYIKDVMKYSKPIEVGVVDCEAFEEATQRVIAYMQLKGFKQCSFVTDEQEIFKALNMKAAVGALYGGKKKDYFKDFTDAEKEQIVMQSCLRLYKGQLGIWNGSLKAELRCKEKVLANKTRTFTAAPLDTLLGGKVCVDDFNNQFYSKNIECCWTVGMTKFYGGWNRLLTSLPTGWVYCDADGSQFDSSLTPYLINAVLAIRCTYMEDWDIGHQMLKNLYTEIIYTPIATPDGTIIKKFRGNNSGQPSTVVDNSLMVVLAMHYAFVKEGVQFGDVDRICKFFVNGDDLIIAIDPAREDILDRLAGHFSSLGLNYDFSSRTRRKEELWFMSHKGIEFEGIYIPKLEEERIVSILQWDRATLPEHRLEAICAAMIESWGYPHLIHQIRRFYSWLLKQQPFAALAAEGKAPYIAEMALKKLYLDRTVNNEELMAFQRLFVELDDDFECEDFEVHHQVGEHVDAGKDDEKASKDKQVAKPPASKEIQEKDVNAGTSGTHTIPRIKAITGKMRLPKIKGKDALNLPHLLEYSPQQIDISNTRATHEQFNAWHEAVKQAYDINDEEMSTLMNGLMVWCIENGTSPNINGVWVMMDGEQQVEYPLKPIVEHAKPTLRQIMAHFSDVAEAYIEMRNKKEPYMPRYGLIRNLRDASLARYAFDFYEVTSRTPTRAREAHIQMKAAALKSVQTRMFGLDGGINTQEENTERHTTEDVSPNMHSLLGVRNI